MNKLISLTKIQLKDFFSKYQSGMNISNQKWSFLILAGVMLALLMPAYQISSVLFRSFYQAGFPELTVTYMYVATAIIAFIASIPFVISIFFYSKDLKLLATLPVGEDIIIYSKLSTVYIYILGMSTILLGPSIFFHIYYSRQLISLLMGIVGILITPIIPVLLSLLVVLVMMRFLSLSSKRNILSIVGGFLLLAIVVGVQLAVVRLQVRPEFIQEMLAKEDGLLRIIGYRFPPSIWFTKMLQGSFVDTIMFLGLNIILLFLLRIISRTFYQRALQAFNVEGSRGLMKGKLYYKKQSVGLQLVKRHILIIIHNPTFFLNTFLSLMVPLLMFAMTIFTGEMALDIFRQPALQPYLLLIYSGILISPAIIGNISATVITREGKAFWETLILPITPQQNLRYRVISTLVISGFGSVVLGVLALLIIPVTLTEIILAVFATISVTLLLSTADIIINIERPFLNWSNPTAAVKNNLNVMLSLGIRLIYGLIIFVLIRFLNLNTSSIVILVAILSFILFLIVRQLLYTRYTKVFTNIHI